MFLSNFTMFFVLRQFFAWFHHALNTCHASTPKIRRRRILRSRKSRRRRLFLRVVNKWCLITELVTSNWRSFLTSTKWNKHESGLFWNFRPYWMTYRSKKWFSSLALFRNLDWLFPYVFTIERYCTLVIFYKIAYKSAILWVFSLR